MGCHEGLLLQRLGKGYYKGPIFLIGVEEGKTLAIINTPNLTPFLHFLLPMNTYKVYKESLFGEKKIDISSLVKVLFVY